VGLRENLGKDGVAHASMRPSPSVYPESLSRQAVTPIRNTCSRRVPAPARLSLVGSSTDRDPLAIILAGSPAAHTHKRETKIPTAISLSRSPASGAGDLNHASNATPPTGRHPLRQGGYPISRKPSTVQHVQPAFRLLAGARNRGGRPGDSGRSQWVDGTPAKTHRDYIAYQNGSGAFDEDSGGTSWRDCSFCW